MSLIDPEIRGVVVSPEERRVVQALRDGDEHAFTELVETHSPAMLRVARLYVRTHAVAEEVVQETWLAVLRSLDAFEGRSTLRTWIFAILGNTARKRGTREARSTPMNSETAEALQEQFFPAGHRWAGMWSTIVEDWGRIPDEDLLGREAQAQLSDALKALPIRYASIFVLRDVEGWSSDEVCGVFGLTPANQRVLLHRARTRIRTLLADYFEQSTA